MRSWVFLAVLGVAVAALGAWVYFKPSASDANSHALSRLQAKDVKRVRVERLDPARPAPAIVLERHDAGWRMIAPLAARADTGQVERLLGILDARSAARYPAADLARYGLDQPQGRVTIEDQVYAYGAINTMTREQYVLTGDFVYTVPIARSSTLPRDSEALLARALFAPGEAPARFELPGFAATLDEGTWKLAPAGEASADERNTWADSWRHATAVRATRHDGRAPAATIKVALKDGRMLEIGILRGEPGLVLVRADESIEFHFLPEVGKRLLSPPGGDARAEKK